MSAVEKRQSLEGGEERTGKQSVKRWRKVKKEGDNYTNSKLL